VTKRKVEIISHFVRCPFCDYLVEITNPAAWCANCYCEYTVGSRWVMFDDEKANPRFVLAKTIDKAGGVSFGSCVYDNDAKSDNDDCET
jgi:hypothetical protein